MPKLQEAKKGGFFVFINTSIIKVLGWKKGDEILPTIFGRGQLLFKNEGKKKVKK